MVEPQHKSVDPALVVRLAEEHGTPYYLYDAARIRKRVDDLAAFDEPHLTEHRKRPAHLRLA